VDLIRASKAETRGVDAFALSLIKAEKQARRLVTFLVYQHPWCSQTTIPDIRDALWSSKKVYFEGVLRGWDALHRRSIEDLVGSEYARLKGRLDAARPYRDKIFHGQLTSKGLSRSDLLGLAADIRAWCDALAVGTLAEVGYDGCSDSFHKARNAAALCTSYRENLPSLNDYRSFIKRSGRVCQVVEKQRRIVRARDYAAS
jgi:hypothetical protein